VCVLPPFALPACLGPSDLAFPPARDHLAARRSGTKAEYEDEEAMNARHATCDRWVTGDRWDLSALRVWATRQSDTRPRGEREREREE
jgi:hypothetical protein